MTCPHCRADLRGAEIPPESREPWEAPGGELLWPYGEGSTHFSRAIGIEIGEVYDGILMYRCPDCTRYWHRWEPGTWQHSRAAALLTDWGLS